MTKMLTFTFFDCVEMWGFSGNIESIVHSQIRFSWQISEPGAVLVFIVLVPFKKYIYIYVVCQLQSRYNLYL